MSKKEKEEGLILTPTFDKNGLIPCVTTCAETSDVLMFAFMNEEALSKSIETGEAHYWSRSRQSLWHKGATSGHIQKIIEMRTDCDQDCIWIKVKSKSGACHTGRKSCFYRKIQIDPKAMPEAKMHFIDDEKLFDPKDVYK